MASGLTPQELKDLLEYIQKNNSWDNMYEIISAHPKRKIIKYVRFSVDTRQGDIWCITFDNLIGAKENESTFRTEKDYNLKDKIYEWLNEEKR
jgi:hypothetical protein